MWLVSPSTIGQPDTRRESASRDQTPLLREDLGTDPYAIGDRAPSRLVMLVENPRHSLIRMAINDLANQPPRSVLAAMIQEDDLIGKRGVVQNLNNLGHTLLDHQFLVVTGVDQSQIIRRSTHKCPLFHHNLLASRIASHTNS